MRPAPNILQYYKYAKRLYYPYKEVNSAMANTSKTSSAKTGATSARTGMSQTTGARGTAQTRKTSGAQSKTTTGSANAKKNATGAKKTGSCKGCN